MVERIFLCGACGTKNRVLRNKSGQPKCGSCGKPLPVPEFSPTVQEAPQTERKAAQTNPASRMAEIGPYKDFLKLVIIIALIVSAYAISKWYDGTSKPLGLSQQNIQKFNAPPIAVSPGVIQSSLEPRLSPLAIKTHSGNDYYVKLIKNGLLVMTMYIQGGQYFETKVPLGTYELRYAAGRTWYGTKYHFGPDTLYSKAEELFEFRSDGSNFTGYTIELILQANGNLRTSELSPQDF